LVWKREGNQANKRKMFGLENRRKSRQTKGRYLVWKIKGKQANKGKIFGLENRK
jgi:hypothetical protein